MNDVQFSGPSGRATIGDIAKEAGISKVAVSYALNGKSGVSEVTRQRVRDIADRLGWVPNGAARALSKARAHSVGLVLARPARMLGIEPFYMEFISGVEATLAAQDYSLMLHVVDTCEHEIKTYETWWGEHRVDGALLVDLREQDQRIDAVRRLALPVVCVSTRDAAHGLPVIWTDDVSAIEETMHYLVELGHTRIARVSGPPELSHTAERDRTFRALAARSRLPQAPIVPTDFSGESGARVTRQLLNSDDAPTAIIYDNDVMAVAGLGVAQQMGVRVPGELSIVAWDDSALSAITHPPLTALRRDIPALGATAASMLLDLIDGRLVQDREGSRPRLEIRASAARAPGPTATGLPAALPPSPP